MLSEQQLNDLVNEVRYMNSHDKWELLQAYRAMYGYQTVMASLEELAIELAKKRGLIK